MTVRKPLRHPDQGHVLTFNRARIARGWVRDYTVERVGRQYHVRCYEGQPTAPEAIMISDIARPRETTARELFERKVIK